MSLRVLLVHPLYVVRRGLKALLQDLDMEVCGEAPDTEEALILANHCNADLVMYELDLPGSDGVALTSEFKARHPGIRLLVFADDREVTRLYAALQAGANGFLATTAGAEEIRQAIKTMQGRGSYLDPRVTLGVLGQMRRREKAFASTGHISLSEREQTILACLAKGVRNSEIAYHLVVSVSTVKTYLRALYRKFATSDRTEIVVKAMNMGLLEDGARAGQIV